MKKTRAILLPLIFSLGCKAMQDNSSVKADQVPAQTSTGPTCAAIRGNGELIFGHFGSLAKILETFGVLQGIAGGSSASITTFLYESMYDSPFVRQNCGESSNSVCTDSDPIVGRRLALMLKSMVGFKDDRADAEPFRSAASLIKLIAQIRGLFEEMKTPASFSTATADPASAYTTLATLAVKAIGDANVLVKDPLLADVLNQKLIVALAVSAKSLAAQGQTPSQIYATLNKTVSSMASIEGSDVRVLFREGPINFRGLARRFGMIANFYAGYGHNETTESTKYPNAMKLESTWKAAMHTFVRSCSGENTVGMNWAGISAMQAANGTETCGQLFSNAVTTYHGMLNSVYESAGKQTKVLDTVFKQRLNDFIGKLGNKMTAIATTSYLNVEKNPNIKDGLYRNFEAAMAAYNANNDAPISPDIFGQAKNHDYFREQLKFAYWTSAATQTNIIENGKSRTDLKTAKRTILVNTLWSSVLAISPAEPGLAPAQGFDNGAKISTGGWDDLHPVQILKDAGCKQVIYITRTAPEAKFSQQIATHLGMDDAIKKELFGLGPNNPNSGFNTALKEADVVWCTHWNDFKLGKTKPFFETVFDDSYNAKFEIHKTTKGNMDQLIAHTKSGPLQRQYMPSGANLVGCTPGVADPAESASVQPQ